MDAPELTATEHRLLDNIDAHGWQSMHVFDPELARPNFTYSIGFTETLNAPEFIVFGLHRDVMHDMLSDVFRQIKAGRKVEGEQRWQGLVDGHDCIAKKADHADLFTDYVTWANWYWKHRGNKGHPGIIQLVWPGQIDGLFPWDEGCAQAVIDAQPRLWA
ncbi:DUF4262 domain-containing protein [Hyphomonas johnsonii]|uniref:DUF4262 domain-containing protein n=1 Tax=Hyphomonas johnsonii MHS-2 TaxID=1280950 RepID=A0A059FNU4_9PROT|nr:DUF4262 domain-containing protein [Hyphomonas johnsonii]KCZ92314.1 hypothetical protein HJO_09774 [Hyphomonas johnsonii MHS-2]